MSGVACVVVCVAVGLGDWKKIMISLISKKGCLIADVPSAVSSRSAPSLCDSEVPSSMGVSSALAPLSCCKFSISGPDVTGSDKATFASSAIVEGDRTMVAEMVGESSVGMRVNTRFSIRSDAK